jgi:asparagine synthase (glutamine-hydrolysing)
MGVQAGIWNFDGRPVDQECLATISQHVAEYGRDGERTYCDGHLGMLYRPFYTTIESRFEHQPFVSSGGRVITWVGRLDNRDELTPQLWDDLTSPRPDVAVAAAALDRWGTDCFAKLIGDWAMCVWDPREEKLVIARDYVGIKHLFYYQTPKRLLWCSHLAPLALCGDKFSLCGEYVAGYLASYPEAHLTPFREIHSVLPGHFVQIVNGRITTHTYWTLPTHQTHYRSDSEYEEHYRVLLRKSVRRRLRTGSAILAELSGGLDSSSIVCMADDILSKEGAEATRVDTR